MARRARPRAKTSTRGRDALARYIASSATRSQTSVARELGVEQATVSFWLSGKFRPDPQYRIAMQRLFGIKAEDWLTRDEHQVAFGRTGS